jgi:hypothetical protein
MSKAFCGKESLIFFMQIFFSPKSLKFFLGIQGFFVLFSYIFSPPVLAQIFSTNNSITVIGATPATAGSPGAIAIGSAASSSGDNAISIGISTIASGNRSVAIGSSVEALSPFATGLGFNASARGISTVAIGVNSKALADSAIVIGDAAEATTSALNGVAIGNQSTALGNRALALGTFAQAAEFGTALGGNAEASQNRSIAIGINSKALAESAIAIGQISEALGLRATAVGAAAKASAIQSTAIGNNAVADQLKSSAFGFAAYGSGLSSTAIGTSSNASGEFSTSLGAESLATAPFSTAIGAQAIATQPNQIVIGTNSSKVTIPSLGKDGSFLGTTNQNGTTRLWTTDAEGNLGTSNVSVSQVERLPAMESAMYKMGTAMNAGTSIALALSAVPTVSEDPREPIRCGVGTGSYGGTYAFGLGCAAKVFNRLHVNGGLSFAPPVDYGYGTTPKIGGRIGFSFPFGVRPQSSPSTVSSAASTINGASDGETRAVIEQLRNELDRQKQTTLKLQQQLESLIAKSGS